MSWRLTILLLSAWFAGWTSLAGQSAPVAPATDAKPAAPTADRADGALAVTVPTYANASCPVMGKPISSRLWTDTDFGRIWICCKGCNKKIAADVAAAYKTAYPRSRKLENKNCPVSGKPIEGEATVISLQGNEVRLHSADCVALARADSQVVLARALQPELVDVGNAVCPITGKPTVKNVFGVIDGRIVRFSGPECIEAARKDPKGVLERALAEAKRAAGQ